MKKILLVFILIAFITSSVYAANQQVVVQTLTYAATKAVTPPVRGENQYYMTLTGALTLTIAKTVKGDIAVFYFTCDSTARTVTFGNYFTASSNFTLIASQVNIIRFTYTGVTWKEEYRTYGNNGTGDSLVISTPATITAYGIKMTGTAAVNVAFGDLCYMNSSSKFALGNASVIATSSCIAMCADSTITANASGNFLLFGIATKAGWAWTVGGLIYLSTTGTTTNTLTQTAPSGANNVVQIIGAALSATSILVNPNLVQVEHN